MSTATLRKDARGASGERAAEDRRLLVRYGRERDAPTRAQLVERFLPLAFSLARRYSGSGESLEDLQQIASLGLLKAVDRYDASHQTAFSSFAVPTILGELRRHFRDKGWAVRVPRDLQELAVKVERVAQELPGELGRFPTAAELAARCDTTVEQALEARQVAAARHTVSFDRPQGEDDEAGTSLRDTLGEEDRGFETAEAAASLDGLLRVLSERGREVLRLRFEEDLTQAEIGARVGVSQMQVSRLLRQSITMLREEAEARDAPRTRRALALDAAVDSGLARSGRNGRGDASGVRRCPPASCRT
jgi:RNA polymerase sigma-B factor